MTTPKEVAVYEPKNDFMVIIDDITYLIKAGTYPVYQSTTEYQVQVSCYLLQKMYQFDPKSIDISLIGTVLSSPTPGNNPGKIQIELNPSLYKKYLTKGVIKQIITPKFIE